MCPSNPHNHGVAASVPDGAVPGDAPDPALIADLVSANHILFDQGVVNAFGHISVRHDKRLDRFLLARNMAPGSVTADDIVKFDLDGNPVNANGRRVYLECFIHGVSGGREERASLKSRPALETVMQSRLADGTLTPGMEIASIMSCSKTCPAPLPCWNSRRWDSAAPAFRWARGASTTTWLRPTAK